jgi:flagellum-specific ATP synthase
MTAVTTEAHQRSARAAKQAYALYQQNHDLINLGAYQQGADPRLDLAINIRPRLDRFLTQGMKEVINLEASINELEILTRPLMRAGA